MRTLSTALVGFFLGVVLAVSPSCGPTAPRCLASNCAGCCDENGVCQKGDESFACGARAATCSQCAPNEACANAVCTVRTGDGGVFVNDGGVVCSAANCAGCCDAMGNCRGGNTNSGCGQNGAACAACPTGQACQNFACAAFQCPGCVNGAGTCLNGDNIAACGSGGGACAACPGGQACVSGACMAQATCSAANCSGCCDGNSCITTTTNTQCGRGGFACTACSSPNVCNSGSCGPVVVDAGPPPDAGPSGPCGFLTCTTGCCDGSSGACLPGTATAACGIGGDICQKCTGFLAFCTPLIQTCGSL